jgi:hypothetical protein
VAQCGAREGLGVMSSSWTIGLGGAVDGGQQCAGSVRRRSPAKGRKEKLGLYMAKLGRLMLAEQATVGLCIDKEKRGRARPARGRNSFSSQTARKIGNHFFYFSNLLQFANSFEFNSNLNFE